MRSPSVFRRNLLVDAGGTPRILDSILDLWQRADFDALDAGWQRVAGQSDESSVGVADAGGRVFHRGYLERPRGHSKTADLAAMISWALFASRNRIIGNAIAADREQARLLRSAVQNLTLSNSWLRDYLDPMRDRIANPHTGSELTILSSDAPSVFGQTPAFIVADELCHWQSEDLWTACFSAAAKRAGCMVVVISNAGTGAGRSWQWRVREHARTHPDWYFSRLDGPQASWIGPEQLEEQRMLLPPAAYKRLWLNEWTTDAGDALPAEDIEAAITLDGPERSAADGSFYLAGLDLGVKRDHSALVVVGVEPGSRRVRLAACESWRPGPGGKVDLVAVREAVLGYHKRFGGLAWVGFDPFQAALMAQELAAAGVPMTEVAFSGKTLNTMASTLLGAFRGRQIDLFDDRALIDDLGRLVILQRRFGYRLDAPSDAGGGHADRAIALSIVLPLAMEVACMEVAQGPSFESMPTRVFA